MNSKRLLFGLLIVAIVIMGAAQVTAQEDISIVHYYSSTLGQATMTSLFQSFEAAHPEYHVIDNMILRMRRLKTLEQRRHCCLAQCAAVVMDDADILLCCYLRGAHYDDCHDQQAEQKSFAIHCLLSL